MRGEYIRGDGLVIPNSITSYGGLRLLEMALRGAYVGMQVRLGNVDSQDDITLAAVNYPANLSPLYINNNAASWPIVNQIEGYVETLPHQYSLASGQVAATTVSRVLLLEALGPEEVPLGIISASERFEPLLITSETPSVQRTFRYRIYGG